MGSAMKDIAITLRGATEAWPATVVGTRPYSLLISFTGTPPDSSQDFIGCALELEAATEDLGACRFEPHPAHPHRRADDRPRPVGDGTLIFLDGVFDFGELLRHQRVLDLRQKLTQLPLMLSRRQAIVPAFRDYCADLLYDLSVRRCLYDQTDRQLSEDAEAARTEVHRLLVESEYPTFVQFMDKAVAELKELVAPFSRAEHEQHGFYFRKQLWDILLRSALLARTNVKPRGYAGDSEMMEMIYANEFVGDTIFEKFMHKYAVALDAAQAVRNRRDMIRQAIDGLRAANPTWQPLRLLSVACGPARELTDLLTGPAEREAYHLTLLDQDAEALAQARSGLLALDARLGGRAHATFVKQSVRTMLRAPDLSSLLGRHHVIYAMGLFDYLAQPVAKAVLARCWDLLEPGGEILIGNYHKGHHDRVFMDYWADWVLLYRREADMLALAEKLPMATARVIFEETGCQMFLRVRKEQ